MLSSSDIKKIKKFSLYPSKYGLDRVFSALADPTRLEIFRLLIGHKDLCVTDIAKILDLSLAAVSHQLTILEQSGLISRERVGKMKCFSISHKNPVLKSVKRVIQVGRNYSRST